MNHPSPPPCAHADAFLAEAAALLGVRGLTTDPDRVDAWLTDWRGRWTGVSAAILQPESTEQVAALVSFVASDNAAQVRGAQWRCIAEAAHLVDGNSHCGGTVTDGSGRRWAHGGGGW